MAIEEAPVVETYVAGEHPAQQIALRFLAELRNAPGMSAADAMNAALYAVARVAYAVGATPESIARGVEAYLRQFGSEDATDGN